jgi:membrane protein YdbS with pleckstrin-like domain
MSTELERADAVPSQVADGIYHSLDPNVIQLDRITGFIVTAVVAVILAVSVVVTWLAVDEPWVARMLAICWPVITGLLAWSSFAWPEISFRHEAYRLDDHGLEIRRGVIWRRIISVPRSRVQHIDVSQGPIERRFGLGSLRIYTAGTEHAIVGLHGLPHARALLLRDQLLPREAQDAV